MLPTPGRRRNTSRATRRRATTTATPRHPRHPNPSVNRRFHHRRPARSPSPILVTLQSRRAPAPAQKRAVVPAWVRVPGFLGVALVSLFSSSARLVFLRRPGSAAIHHLQFGRVQRPAMSARNDSGYRPLPSEPLTRELRAHRSRGHRPSSFQNGSFVRISQERFTVTARNQQNGLSTRRASRRKLDHFQQRPASDHRRELKLEPLGRARVRDRVRVLSGPTAEQDLGVRRHVRVDR